MRTLFDTDEEEIEGKSSEITLSTASLLGIFFGLVLVCGVFFGFGYSIGRGTGATAQASPVHSSPSGNTGEADETAAAQNPPAPAAQEPSDDSQAKAKAAPPPVAARPKVEETPKEDAAETEKATAPVAVETAAQLVTSKPAAGKISPAYQPPTDAPPTATGQAMVQIAAVSRPQDADVLVAALRQRGYGVVVRSEPQDHLLHVQVGPFANRTQATEVKQKLLSDGYNAIIKQ